MGGPLCVLYRGPSQDPSRGPREGGSSGAPSGAGPPLSPPLPPAPRAPAEGAGLRSRESERKGRGFLLSPAPPRARAAHVVTGTGREPEAEEGAGGWARAGGA